MPKGQSKKDNPEKLAAQGTQDEEKNRETVNIGYTRRRKEQRNCQQRVHKTKKRTEKPSTQGTQDEEKNRNWQQRRRQTKCLLVIQTKKNKVSLGNKIIANFTKHKTSHNKDTTYRPVSHLHYIPRYLIMGGGC